MLFLVFVGGARAADQTPESETGGVKPAMTAITGVHLDHNGDDFMLRVQCATLPTYTMYELFDPLRIILDIANGSLQEAVKLPLSLVEGPVSLIQGHAITDKDPAIVRLEMLMAGPHSYSVKREANDIVITFPHEATIMEGIEVTKSPTETRVLVRTNGKVREYRKEELGPDDRYPARMYIDIKKVTYKKSYASQQVGTALKDVRLASHGDGIRIVFDSGLPKLFSYEIVSTTEGLAVTIQEPPALVISSNNAKGPAMDQVAEKEAGRATPPSLPAATPAAGTAEPEMTGKTLKQGDTQTRGGGLEPRGSFSEAGYEKQRITVDFYKIDLHNVFRLIGEISGLNIIVDEGVSGTLTLALNNVPWDFALDVILNLKDLQKEERFNTLIIAPKSRTFNWPEHKPDTLAVRADGTPVSVESLSVQKRLETPKEVIEAKQLAMAGKAAEQQGDYAGALQHYEEAFAKWPGNNQLADRIASLYLVQEGMNAKAVHYAKEALKSSPDDRAAALYAAVSLANMKKTAAAKEYFELAVRETEGGTKPAAEALMSYAVFNEELENYVAALLLLARHEELYGDSLETMVAKARIYDKEGNSEKALAEYDAILHSGYELPPDLGRYIKGQLAMKRNTD